jgi:predicted DCC family thiol-disulfide oxidoreductase YuxK
MSVLTERTFGIFVYIMPIAYLAFAEWPRPKVQVLYDGDCGFFTSTRGFMERLDLEGLFKWEPFQQARDLHGIPVEALSERLYLVAGEKKYSGFAAFRMMALYNPLTYFVMLLTLVGPQSLYFHHRSLLGVFYFLIFSPPFIAVGEMVYSVIARNRHSIFPSGNCAVHFPVTPQK